MTHGQVRGTVVTTAETVRTGAGRVFEFTTTLGDRNWDVYDNTSATGDPIAKIAAAAAVPNSGVLSVTFNTGLHIAVASGTTGNLTITHT